jgi:hypothetical protein
LSRFINPETAGKERTKLTKEIVYAIRELMKQQEPDAKSRDLAAFISLSLANVSQTVDGSVEAWEKRGYWVKADHFRMEWIWAGRLGEALKTAVASDDWGAVAINVSNVAQKLMSVKLSGRFNPGEPWQGAFEALKNGKAMSARH